MTPLARTTALIIQAATLRSYSWLSVTVESIAVDFSTMLTIHSYHPLAPHSVSYYLIPCISSCTLLIFLSHRQQSIYIIFLTLPLSSRKHSD